MGAALVLPLLFLLYAALGFVVFLSVRLRRSGSPAFLAPFIGVPVGIYAGWRSFRIGFSAGSVLFGLAGWAALILTAHLAFSGPTRWKRVLWIVIGSCVLSVVVDQTAQRVMRRRDRDRKEYVRRSLETSGGGIVMSSAKGWTLVDVWPLSRTLSEEVVIGYEVRYRSPTGSWIRFEVFPNTPLLRRSACDNTGTTFPLFGSVTDTEPVPCDPVGINTWVQRNQSGTEVQVVQVRPNAIIIYSGLGDAMAVSAGLQDATATQLRGALAVFAGFHDATATELVRSLVATPHGPFWQHQRR